MLILRLSLFEFSDNAQLQYLPLFTLGWTGLSSRCECLHVFCLLSPPGVISHSAARARMTRDSVTPPPFLTTDMWAMFDNVRNWEYNLHYSEKLETTCSNLCFEVLKHESTGTGWHFLQEGIIRYFPSIYLYIPNIALSKSNIDYMFATHALHLVSLLLRLIA